MREVSSSLYDSLVLSAVTWELERSLLRQRIQKIYQPFPYDIYINFSHSRTRSLLLSSHPVMCRAHLTSRRFRQDSPPPNFCMLLRKYLEGGQITEIKQSPWERVISLYIFNGIKTYRLIVEIMGRHSNIILVDKEEKILGALKNITPDMSRYRTVLPGREYYPPPGKDTIALEDMDSESFETRLKAPRDAGLSWENALGALLRGFSPLLSREAVYRAGAYAGQDDFAKKLWKALQDIKRLKDAKEFSPALVEGKGKNPIVTVVEFTQFEGCPAKHFDSVNEMLDFYYSGKQDEEIRNRLKEKLKTALKVKLKRARLKENRQLEESRQAEEAELYRLYGELLLAQIGKVPRRAFEVELTNFYDPAQVPISIPLDPRLPAPANAQNYFKKYRRAQKRKYQVNIQLSHTRAEIEYLDSVLYSIEEAGLPTLEEIREELLKTGYLPAGTAEKLNKRNLPKRAAPSVYISSSGHLIYVGENNFQNDELTFRKAGRKDTWLHVQKIPGSHVIIKDCSFPPPGETLLEAAALAAHFSKGRGLSRVTVDYTEIINVKRAPGGKPGMAIYRNFRSITVSPTGEILDRILSRKKVL